MDQITKWLNRQHRQLGTWEKLAQAMGITVRHLRNVRRGHMSKWVRRDILEVIRKGKA